jgi:hypothetical protein
MTGKKLGTALIAVAALAIALAAFLAYKSYKKKQDETAVVAAVGDSTLLLRGALGAQGAADAVARLDAHLTRIKAATRTPLADAAEDYVLGAREIARRRADAARLASHTAAARQALLTHLASSDRRGGGWFRQATKVKKGVENAYYELGVALKTLDTLLESMHESRKRLGPLVGEHLLIGADALNAGRQSAQEELKRSAEELERARQLPL